jgi:hypothetical protein
VLAISDSVAASSGVKEAPAAEPAVQAEAVKAAAMPARFFVDRMNVLAPAHARISVDALMLQLETHVRLEQAAAESFLEAPSRLLLHGRTTSPLLN